MSDQPCIDNLKGNSPCPSMDTIYPYTLPLSLSNNKHFDSLCASRIVEIKLYIIILFLSSNHTLHSKKSMKNTPFFSMRKDRSQTILALLYRQNSHFCQKYSMHTLAPKCSIEKNLVYSVFQTRYILHGVPRTNIKLNVLKTYGGNALCG